MKSRGLIVATVVLAALTGTLYWSNHHKPADNAAKTSADTPPKILALHDADIAKVELRKKGGGEVILVKDGSGKWQIAAQKPIRADQDAVSSMLSTLSSLNAERLIEDKASNLSQYGLTEPALEVGLTGRDGKTQELLVGDDTPTGSAVYAKLGGDPRVFSIASYTKSSFDKTSNDLRDKRLLAVDADKISRVELITKKHDVEFGRSKDEWQILKPKPLRADGFQVEELVRKVKDAKMDLGTSDADEKKAASAFSSGSRMATVKVTDESGTQELQVRKNKDDYYAKSSSVEGAHKVPSELGKGLDKSLEEFRNKKLFDFGFTDPNKIEMHDGPKAYFLTRSGDDWWSDGKKMDAGSLFSFLGKIRDLAASKFPDSGFTAPQIDLTVTSNDGKRVEKVVISKNGDTYIANRENEPSLYELDPKAVLELEKSASELKPAALPAKK
ncbi:MAG TPA: DUF4340 domain-containing protein [Candidatus Acidoferrales bacterium]|nr:DUF4340 domain-containing protein [Candidatus Acidoferrales bacterium]